MFSKKGSKSAQSGSSGKAKWRKSHGKKGKLAELMAEAKFLQQTDGRDLSSGKIWQRQDLKFKWLPLDSNPQPLSS